VKKIIVIIIALVFFLELFPGCANSPNQEQENEIPVGLMKQHDTRVVIVCKKNDGQYLEKSLHISESVKCGKAIFNMKDFAKLGKESRYIAFPGQENELKKYLTKIEKP
jgi:hypothetical protein